MQFVWGSITLQPGLLMPHVPDAINVCCICAHLLDPRPQEALVHGVDARSAELLLSKLQGMVSRECSCIRVVNSQSARLITQEHTCTN